MKGRAWIFGDDVDTDQIYPGMYLPLTDKQEMAQHAMEGAAGGAEFIKGVEEGDILVAGKNFGCGSSREHAAVAIKGIGISVVIARSFARIFRRNAVNTGLSIIELSDIQSIHQGDELDVNISTGTIKNMTKESTQIGVPLSPLEMDILKAGGLLEFLKKQP